MASRSAEQAERTAWSMSVSPAWAWAANWSGAALNFVWKSLMNPALSSLSEAEFQAAPTTTPSAASPASAMSFGLLKPLPPMMGMVMPSSRAWVTSGMAASIRPETTIASGFWPLAWVSSARKSVSALEKVIVSRICTPSVLRAASKTLKPDSVKASSLLYITTTLARLNFSLAFLMVCGMTWASVSESRKM